MTKKISDGACYVCDGAIVWNADKNGKAYYACQHCQTRVFMGLAASNALKASIVKQEEKKHGKGQKIQAEHRAEKPDGNPAAAGDDAAASAAAAGGKPAGGFGGFFSF